MSHQTAGPFLIHEGYLVNYQDDFAEDESWTDLRDFIRIDVNKTLQQRIVNGEVGYAVERIDEFPAEEKPFHRLPRCGGNIKAWRQRWGCLVGECEASTTGHGIFRGLNCTGSQCYFCFSCAMELRANPDGKCPLGCGQPWEDHAYQFAPYEAGLFALCQVLEGKSNQEQASEIIWVQRRLCEGDTRAVRAGTDSGRPVYIIRASHLGGMVPGKWHAGRAYIPYNCREIVKPVYEVMTCPTGMISWVQTSYDRIPNNAVVGGRDPNGEVYYIGRASLNSTLTTGKVHPSHQRCYISYDGLEHNFTHYEILVRNDVA